MQRYRCPKCGRLFYGKILECPVCHAKYHFHGDPLPEEKIEENKLEEVEKNNSNLTVTLVNDIENIENNEKEVIENVEEAKEESPQFEVVTEPEPVEEEIPEVEIDTTAPSYFDGRLYQMIGWGLLGGLVTIVTLGICYPLAYGWMVAWKTNHTVINGYRQKFVGVAGSLIPRWILWGFLTIITLTIFGWWTPIRLKKWRAERTIQVKDEK